MLIDLLWAIQFEKNWLESHRSSAPQGALINWPDGGEDELEFLRRTR